MDVRPLSLGERAAFQHSHDLSERDAYAVDLIALCCGVHRDEAQHFWDNESVGATHELVSRCEEELKRDTVKPATDLLAADSLLSAILGVCEHYQITFTQFQTWSAQDQELAVAYYIESRDTCPGCGLSKRLRNTFITIKSETCIHCEQLKHVQDSMPEDIRHKTHLTISTESS